MKQHWGSKLIETKPPYFSTNLQHKICKTLSKKLLEYQWFNNMKNTQGYPSSLAKKKKKESFNNIKQQVWKKFQGWEAKLLSQVGREILIKATAQSLPTYMMSCFKLSIGLCHDIEALSKKFFWGQRGDGQKIHQIKWDVLCKPKTHGEMGFKDLSSFNDALLTKQTWQLLHDKTSLFYWVFKAKFFLNCLIMEVANPSSTPYAWKSILKGREVIQR